MNNYFFPFENISTTSSKVLLPKKSAKHNSALYCLNLRPLTHTEKQLLVVSKQGLKLKNVIFSNRNILSRPECVPVQSLLHFGGKLKHKPPPPPLDEMTHLLSFEKLIIRPKFAKYKNYFAKSSKISAKSFSGISCDKISQHLFHKTNKMTTFPRNTKMMVL